MRCKQLKNAGPNATAHQTLFEPCTSHEGNSARMGLFEDNTESRPHRSGSQFAQDLEEAH